MRSTGFVYELWFLRALTPVNLATSYLGIPLGSPFIVGASPCCDDLSGAQKLQEFGASAVVMRSLFEEQVSGAPFAIDDDARTIAVDYHMSVHAYLRHIERLKAGLSIPVIASLNGHHPGGWVQCAQQIERAGADAIELNFYRVVTDPEIGADQVETEMLEIVGAISTAVRIPVAAKISPYHASVSQLAIALELAGAAGVVIFNRFYQADIDIDEVRVQPELKLSDSAELLLRLRWLAILSPLLRGSLSVTGGVHSSAAAVKALLTGATTVQLVSVLLRRGPHVIATLRTGLERWMREHGYDNVAQFRGMLNLQRCGDPSAYERANYIRVLQSWKA